MIALASNADLAVLQLVLIGDVVDGQGIPALGSENCAAERFSEDFGSPAEIPACSASDREWQGPNDRRRLGSGPRGSLHRLGLLKSMPRISAPVCTDRGLIENEKCRLVHSGLLWMLVVVIDQQNSAGAARRARSRDAGQGRPSRAGLAPREPLSRQRRRSPPTRRHAPSAPDLDGGPPRLGIVRRCGGSMMTSVQRAPGHVQFGRACDSSIAAIVSLASRRSWSGKSSSRRLGNITLPQREKPWLAQIDLHQLARLARVLRVDL